VAPGHVAHVVQAGYMIGERVLRPAMVGVAKAAPKSAQPASANDNPGTDTIA
jgi:molecular chaperone GrpE